MKPSWGWLLPAACGTDPKSITNTLDFDFAVDGYDPSWSSTSTPRLTVKRWSPGLVVTTESPPTEAM